MVKFNSTVSVREVAAVGDAEGLRLGISLGDTVGLRLGILVAGAVVHLLPFPFDTCLGDLVPSMIPFPGDLLPLLPFPGDLLVLPLLPFPGDLLVLPLLPFPGEMGSSQLSSLVPSS